MSGADRLAHPPEAAVITGQGADSIDGLEAAGNFPVRVPLPDGGHGWRLSEVFSWAQDRQQRQAVCAVAMRP